MISQTRSVLSNLAIVKPKTAIEKKTSTTVDTIMVTPDRISKWKLPSGQRPLRENNKVRDLAEKIKADGSVIPGIITLGVLNGDYWIIDGQHRLHSFLLSGLKEGYADTRFFHADTLSDINREFVELNSKLVTMRPDDFLRGLEGSIEALQLIRKHCPFVGYDLIRRNGNSGPVLSMSAALRAWRSSGNEVPAASNSGLSAVGLAETMVSEETRGLIEFLQLAHLAFSRDREYRGLWTALNLALCMWLYRRLVLTQWSPKTPRIEKDLFKKCLMSLSTDTHYLDWLLGRHCNASSEPESNLRRDIRRLLLDQGWHEEPYLESTAWVSDKNGYWHVSMIDQPERFALCREEEHAYLITEEIGTTVSELVWALRDRGLMDAEPEGCPDLLELAKAGCE